MQTITLPLPPSVNRYYRVVNGRPVISSDGREFRRQVEEAVREQGVFPFGGQRRLAVHVLVERADNRRADLDNVQKALLDAMEHAKVYDNDGQIDRLYIDRGPVAMNPRVTVTLAEVKPLARNPNVMELLGIN